MTPKFPVHPDTPQQKAVLRQSPTARRVRKMWPAGARVTAAGHDTGVLGTIQRHVPMTNAQGGDLVVLWDNGTTGRHSPIALRLVTKGQS